MNTTELRKLANRATQECMYSDFYAAASPAQVITLLDEIDRLRTEAVAADIRIANDALEIAELTKLAVSRYDEIANLIQQRDAALAERDAKLAALEKQEPVAYRFPKAGVDNGYNYCDSLDGEEPRFLKLWEKLYAAAGAAPVPNGYRLVSIAQLNTWGVYDEETAHQDLYAAAVRADNGGQP